MSPFHVANWKPNTIQQERSKHRKEKKKIIKNYKGAGKDVTSGPPPNFTNEFCVTDVWLLF